MGWNYRVVQSFDGEEFFIAEVVEIDGKIGWADNHASRLKWDTLEDLKFTVGELQKAFDRPLMRVVENDDLVEL